MDHSAGSDHMGSHMMNMSLPAVVGSVTESPLGEVLSEMNHHGAHHMSHVGDLNEKMDMDTMTTTGGSHGGHEMSMAMTFHVGYTEVILFDWWSINSIGGLLGSMIGIFMFALLYEGLKYAREHLFRMSVASLQYCPSIEKREITDTNKPLQFMEQIIVPPTMNMLSKSHAIQTLLHMVQFVMAYFLMLIFMTYNVWLCLACVLGASTGYFFFGWRKSVVMDITEHCH